MKIKENVSLAKYTTWRVGGPARYFAEVNNLKELIEVIKVATTKQLPYFILGGGSNLLISDRGFRGLVIKLKNKKIKFKENILEAEAGASLSQLVEKAADRGLSGLEWAYGIPGSLGGAIFGQAGAFGQSLATSLKKVKVLQPNLEIKEINLTKKDFKYRQSIFQKKDQIIIWAQLKLKKKNQKEIKTQMKKYLAYRRQSQPLNSFSAGCVFKNPSPTKSAGALIEDCQLKGKKIGAVTISDQHANFILNSNQAKAQDIFKLIQLIKKKVYNKHKLKLKEEIKYLGF